VSRAEPDDLVIFHTLWVQLTFAYYLRGTPTDLVLQSTPLPMFADDQHEPLVTDAQLAGIDAAVGDRQRVWLVHSHFWYSDPNGLVPERLQEILPHCETETFFWDIEAWFCATRVLSSAGKPGTISIITRQPI
jgi:hypothetical protein